MSKVNLRKFLKESIFFKVLVWFRRANSSYENYEREVRDNIYVYSATHDLIKKVAFDNNLKVFVETGTLVGNTILGVKNSFNKIYSIELNKKLHKLAKQRFRDDINIKLVQGDSSKELSKVLTEIIEPALFWLDAHYSSGVTAMGKTQTPIMEELRKIFNHPIKRHYVLIDDVKDFNGTNGYPEIQFLLSWVEEETSKRYRASVSGPIILIEPNLYP
jgi:hypothetical protein